jgi:integrase
MSQSWKLSRYRGKLALVFYADGKRHRFTLATRDPLEAERRATKLYAELMRPQAKRVDEIWAAFRKDYEGRAIDGTLEYTWRALRDRFGALTPDEITIALCRAHVEARRRAGIGDGTINTELGHLTIVLRWAKKHRLIDEVPYIERPSKPKGEAFYLSRSEVRALIGACRAPHVRLFTILALGTAARREAILALTWDRVDFDRGLIDLRDPNLKRPHKGRAVVPMNRAVRQALLEARQGAICDHVIEVAGRRIASVRTGLAAAAARAGLPHVSHHDLRHVAAAHMAEAGTSMEEIAQVLGHSNVNTTRRLYARFSPTYLREATAVLDYSAEGPLEAPPRSASGSPDLRVDAEPDNATDARHRPDDAGGPEHVARGSVAPEPIAPRARGAAGSHEPGSTLSRRNKSLASLAKMVGATGIEPVTPTMST